MTSAFSWQNSVSLCPASFCTLRPNLLLLQVFLDFLTFAFQGFPGGSQVKASASNVGDLGSIPGSGRSPGEGNGNPLQYSCLENPMDREARQATVHGVAKSRTRLSNFTFPYNEKDIFFGCQFQKVLSVFIEPFNFSFFGISGWGIEMDYTMILNGQAWK